MGPHHRVGEQHRLGAGQEAGDAGGDAVEEFLEHRMRSCSCCTDHTGSATIETYVPAHKMNESLLVVMTNWVVPFTDGEHFGKALEASVAEFGEQGEQPAVPGERRRVVVG